MFKKPKMQKDLIMQQMRELEQEQARCDLAIQKPVSQETANNTSYPNQALQSTISKPNTEKRKTPLVRKSTIISILICTIIVVTILCSDFVEDFTIRGEFSYDTGQYLQAVEYFDKALEKDPKDYTAILYKANSLKELEEYEQAITYYNMAADINPQDSQIYLNSGYANFQLEKYNESLRLYNIAIELNPEDDEAYVWKSKNYIRLGNYEDAVKACTEAINIDDKNAETYKLMGEAYLYQKNYDEAIKMFDKSLEIDPLYEDAHISKISALFSQKKYIECIDFSVKAMALFPNNTDIPWYIGDSYSNQGQSDMAIKYYQNVLDINPNMAQIVAYIGWEYFYLQDYETAGKYVEQALKINTENQSALNLKAELENEKAPESEKVVSFIRENYLYFNKINGFEEKAKAFTAKEKVSVSDITQFIDSIKLKDDSFTFVVSGDDYDYLIENNKLNQIVFKELENDICYLRVYSFTSDVANEFRHAIGGIKNTEKKVLIIDLRDNGGGLITPSNNILDTLLPKCTTSYLINREGSIYSYESDINQIKFKKIFILVNENSASSAELLTLGLKKYLDNVTIIGRPTVGKGVGQSTYENRAQKYMIYLVSFYWNVKESNIMGSRIYPDIRVKGSEDSVFIDEVYKRMPKN